MGRTRVASPQGHRTKKEKQLRIEALAACEAEFTAPSFLCSEAKEEFERVVRACKDRLDNLDLSVLAVYADAWANYTRLAKIIEEHGAVIVKRKVTGKVEIYHNPAVAAQAEYVHRIMQCSLKLGMATTDRLKLAVPKQDDDTDEFSEFEGKV